MANHRKPSKHDVQMSPLPTSISIKREQMKARRRAKKREKQQQKQNLGEAVYQQVQKLTQQDNDGGFDDNHNSTSFAVNVLYGMINATIVLPVIMSFGSIIYQDKYFTPYLPTLIRLTTYSGVVHQLVFSSSSSLPFAIGQVQDAGLIFLSKIASRVVQYCSQEDGAHSSCSDQEILATTTVGLAICTAVLGVGVVIIGRLNLASYVQKLPTAVVGGYLAFIGFFCGQSGLGLMAGIDIRGLQDWYLLFDPHRLELILPGVVGGLTIFLLVRGIRHMAVLPCCIISLLVLFYSVMAITETSFEEVTEMGLISEAEDPPVWYHTWDFLQPEHVVWEALFNSSQAMTLFTMILVVALSSSLDIAAIELELGSKLDYNHELRTVGLSNIVSGLLGGYTGSYIFSQSIFTLRAGIRSRVTGYVVAAVELISVVLPFALTSYVPNFFFASLLVMICVDLMVEWLWDVRHKITKAEYAVALSTFVLMQLVGVEGGIIGGILIFVVLYMMGCDMGTPDPNSITPVSSVSSVASLIHLDQWTTESDESDGTQPPNNDGVVASYGSTAATVTSNAYQHSQDVQSMVISV